MSVEFIVRIVGMIVLFAGGYYIGSVLGESLGDQPLLWALVFAFVGALMGLIVTPFITTRPIRKIRSQIAQLSARTMIAGSVGLIVGLLIAVLVAIPLSLLPEPLSQILPFAAALLFGYLGLTIFVMRQNDISNLFGGRFSGGSQEPSDNEGVDRSVLLDTSVIIDGRVADIARTG